MERLQRLKFTARCDEWGADPETGDLHHSGADASFKELWEAWLILDSRVQSLIGTIDQLGLTFQPITVGPRAVRETVSPQSHTFDQDEYSPRTKLLNLEGVAQLCQAFGVPVSFDTIERPVLKAEFKPFKDHRFTQPCEVDIL